jgi:hypothetical protein
MVITAVFGLVGVVVGGLLTAGVDALSKRNEERRTRRRAARVLRVELVWDANRLNSAYEHAMPLQLDPDVLTALWREHRYSLANLPVDDWTEVELAVRHLSQSGWKRLIALTHDDLEEMGVAACEELRAEMQPAANELREAARILHKYVD